MTTAATQAQDTDRPNPADQFLYAFRLLLNFGADLFTRIQAAIANNCTDYLPKRHAKNPQRAEQRVEHTMDWIECLLRTLRGDRSFRIPYRIPNAPRAPSLRKDLRARIGLPPLPPPTDHTRFLARRRYMKKIFASVPTNIIVRRLAARLGIGEDTDFWPTELLAITQTPIEWAKQAHAKPRASAPSEPDPPAPPPQTDTPADPTAPEFHRRE